MPSDGQKSVYGAQHPPNIKLIKELNNLTATSTLSGVSSTTLINQSGSASNTGASGNSFRDFEKKTNDVWDLDDDDGLNDNLDFSFPISITDSEEVAKKIIKNHKENHEKLIMTRKISAASLQSPNKLLSNGPGKALRQENSVPLKSTSSHESSNKNSINNSNNDLNSKNNSQNSHLDSLESSFKSIKLTSSTNDSTNVKQISSNLNSTASINNIETKLDNITTTNTNNKIYSTYVINRDKEEDPANLEKFKKILSNNPINLEELQKASWKGIPKAYRPICWKLLSDYLPLKIELQEKTIEQKRNSYWESVNEHYSSVYIDAHHEMLRQILNDIPRMNPLIPIFQKSIIQNIFQRVLYVWAVRHPASGYVQGINDLLTPFFAVFLTEYSDINLDIQNIEIENLPAENLRQLEADCYWCMTKLLERIQENYVFSQPGIQKNVQSLEDLIKRIDNKLYLHLKKNNIEFIQFAFRWMNNLLMREIPLNCTIRLWDTYHAEPFGFSDFHLYVCAAFLLRFSKNLTDEKDFQGIMLLIQNLPTRNLKANDISLLTAEAYKLQFQFADSPYHTARSD